MGQRLVYRSGVVCGMYSTAVLLRRQDAEEGLWRGSRMSDQVGLVTVFRAGARQKGNHTGACSGKALRTGERGWERGIYRDVRDV